MKMRRLISLILAVLTLCFVFAGCTKAPAKPEEPTETATEPQNTAALEDGTYFADFITDSNMFHVNDTYGGKGVLTVKDGKMTIHITLASTSIQQLFLGTAEDAQKEGAALIDHTVDTVNYDDGTTDEANGFDVAVPYLDDDFDCALIGKKGKWYDHKVSVANPVKAAEDGEYTMDVTLTGGSGKASVTSPAKIVVKNNNYYAEVEWSSSHYEYMTIGETQYDPINTEGNSTFLIPITPDADMEISALTTAMSEPHLIDYVLHFDGSTLKTQ